MAAHNAKKVQSIEDAAELGWRPDGRLRRPSAPPRVAPEVLLRSSLFLVERVERRAQPRRAPELPNSYRRAEARSLPLTIGPETRLHVSLWRKQDKYYAFILLGLAALAWWNPF